MKDISVSIITPFHNVELDLFKKTAASVAEAAKDGWEWIIVLHNTDNTTPEEIRSIVHNDDLVKIYEKKDSKHTPSSPRNYGLGKASGRYVYFLDADDRMEPSFIPAALEIMDKNGHDILLGSVESVALDESVSLFPLPLVFPEVEEGYIVPDDPDIKGNLLYGGAMMLACKLIRRSLIEENGLRFDEDMMCTEDVIFALECYIKAKRICVMKGLTSYCYVQSGESLLQRLIQRRDFNQDVYLAPIQKIVELSVANNISPSSYLWIMLGMIMSILMKSEMDDAGKQQLIGAFQRYFPYMRKDPPEGIGSAGGMLRSRGFLAKKRISELLGCEVDSVQQAGAEDTAYYKMSEQERIKSGKLGFIRLDPDKRLSEAEAKQCMALLLDKHPEFHDRFVKDINSVWRVRPAKGNFSLYYKDISMFPAQAIETFLSGAWNILDTGFIFSCGVFPSGADKSTVLFSLYVSSESTEMDIKEIGNELYGIIEENCR